MTRFAWLQSRTQTAIAAAALAAVAVVAAVTGPQLPHLYDSLVATASHGDCDLGHRRRSSANDRRMHGVRAAGTARACPRLHRHLLGRAARRPRARDRHLPAGLDAERHPLPLAGHQARRRRPGEHGRRRAAQPHRHLVVQPDRPGHANRSRVDVRRARHRADRLRRVRLRARGHRRGADPPHAPRDGRHPGRLHRGPAGRHLLRAAVPHAPLRAISPLVWPRETARRRPGGRRVNPGDWVLSAQTINGAGKVIGQYGGVGPNGSIGFHVSTERSASLAWAPARTLSRPPPSAGARSRRGRPRAFNTAAQECISKLGIRNIVTYQPLSHYWPLQCYETLIFLGLALALAGSASGGLTAASPNPPAPRPPATTTAGPRPSATPKPRSRP